MASEELTEYERKRLENIRRNDQMMASLKLQTVAAQVSAVTKRLRAETKSYKSAQPKKPKTQAPIVIRRSLRTKGLPPDAKGLGDDDIKSNDKTRKYMAKYSLPLKESPSTLGPLSMRDPYSGMSNRALIDAVLGVAKKSQLDACAKGEIGGIDGGLVKEENEDVGRVKLEPLIGLIKKDENEDVGRVKLEPLVGVVKKQENEVGGRVKLEPFSEGKFWTKCGSIGKEEDEYGSGLKLESLTLNPENIARVVPGRIMHLSFFPCTSSRMVVVGNRFGNVGFWNMDSEEEENSGIYLYHPHSGPISGISIQQHCMSKIFTSCYDGLIRLMDAEKEVFDLVYSSEETIYSIAQQSKDPKCLYFSEGDGGLNIWDERIGVCSNQWTLHEKRINSIHFNSENSNLMATSSTDGTACIWDLRSINADDLQSVTKVGHRRTVHSAYFSPSGRSLVTTSLDNTVGISSGNDFGSRSMIYHDNNTSRWIAKFQAICGWDDAHVFVGNKNRGVDVISPVERRTVFTLESPHMSAIPCRFAIHPYNVGMLAGGTGGGQVYVWTLP